MRKIEIDTKFVKRKCKCGHIVAFLSQHPTECRYCGRLVYPTEKFEFMKKIEVEMRKKKYE